MNDRVYGRLICVIQKARPGSPASFQDEEVKNQLLSGLHFEVMEIVAGYLDLTATEIARKFNVIASQREALGIEALGPTDKPLLVVQDKKSYGEFEQVFAFRYGNRQNRFKDETCTYCNKKGHIETVCFAKLDDVKLTKMAQKVPSAMAKQSQPQTNKIWNPF